MRLRSHAIWSALYKYYLSFKISLSKFHLASASTEAHLGSTGSGFYKAGLCVTGHIS